VCEQEFVKAQIVGFSRSSNVQLTLARGTRCELAHTDRRWTRYRRLTGCAYYSSLYMCDISWVGGAWYCAIEVLQARQVGPTSADILARWSACRSLIDGNMFDFI
jgi:hypothetical protein